MNEFQFNDLIDGHVHILDVKECADFPKKLDAIRAVQVGVACQYENSITNANPAGFVLKSRDPGRFYILAGLEHSGLLFNVQDAIPPEEQLRILRDIGIDGIKLLASKPTTRKRLAQPVDGLYFEPFFRECEHSEIPLLWHVADPDEFWTPDLLPEWAKERGWGYDDSFCSKQELVDEALTVLRRFPGLHVVFPHFCFMSGSLDKAAKLLRDFPQVNLDITPGIELFHHLSRNPEKTRDFFCDFADRILFGTDILSSHSIEEIEFRASIVFRFLTSDETFPIPDGADSLLGKPEDGMITGLNLPGGIVNSITMFNFRRIYGNLPRMMNTSFARMECQRLARIEAEVKEIPEEKTQGYAAAIKLGKITVAGI